MSDCAIQSLEPRIESGDQADYRKLLLELGVTDVEAWGQAQDESDQIPFPLDDFPVYVAPSPIHGQGLFASASISSGELIAPARLLGKRTPAGRFINHSLCPNAAMVEGGDQIGVEAARDIAAGEEVTVDYRQALSVNSLIAARMNAEVEAKYHLAVDALECDLATRFPLVEIPTTHRFLTNPGMYVREAVAPAGVILTSAIHKTDHPFVMLSGDQSILDERGEWVRVVAPHMGVTRKGSRRVVLIHSQTTMVTFHATDATDVEAVEAELYERRDQHLVEAGVSMISLYNIQHGGRSRTIKDNLLK